MKIRSIILGLLLLLALVPATGLAQGGWPPNGSSSDPGNGNGSGSGGGGITIDLPNPLACDGGADVSQAQCLLMKIFSALWVLASLLTTLMILVGAFQILTAGGNPEKMETGKRTITYAVIGFVVVILSWSVTSILTSLFNAAAQ